MYMRIRVLGWCALRIYFGLDISELYVAAVLLGRAELLRTISCKSWLKELLIVAVLGLKPANLFDIHRWFSSIYSSAHSHIFKCRLAWLVSASFQPCFSVFAFAYQVAVCVFKQLALLGFESLAFWGFSSNDCPHSPTPPSLFLSSTDSFSVDRCLEWGLMAGLRGFASHGSDILSRGWLATVEAPGYPRNPPSTLARQRLTHFLPFSSIIMNLWIPGNKVFQKEWPQSLNI